MLIPVALYGNFGSDSNPSLLPFGEHPTQPETVFNSGLMLNFYEWGDNDHAPRGLKEYIEWDMLLALRNLGVQNMMAHVSLPVDKSTRRFHRQQNLCIQFTTLPHEVGSNGIPIVVKEGKPTVELIVSVSHYEIQKFIKSSSNKDWDKFFKDKLRSAQS
jgi:hypothetical protein